MPKEYRTIQEVAGPLMLVHGVENVTYDELGEIELASGEVRRCKVLEINGEDALVQLFENSTGINLSNSKVRFLGRSMAVYLTDWEDRSIKDRISFRRREEISMVCQ